MYICLTKIELTEIFQIRYAIQNISNSTYGTPSINLGIIITSSDPKLMFASVEIPP